MFAPSWTILTLLLGQPPVLKTIDGGSVQGTLEFADSQKFTLKTGTGPQSFPLGQVLSLEFPNRPKAPLLYCEAVLVDGSRLRGLQYSIKDETVEWTPLQGAAIAIPLAKFSSILKPAQDTAFAADWKDRLAKARRRDMLVVLRKDKDNPEKSTINGLEGTLGKGSADGKTIGFTPTGSKTELPVQQANLHGLIWLRGTQSDLLAPLGRADDVTGQTMEIGQIRAASSAGLAITLASGIERNLPWESLVRIDFSRGKLAWLSEMEWEPGALTGSEDRLDRVRRDSNLDGGPIKIRGVTYDRGLAFPAPSQVSYALKGEYRELQAIVGADDSTGSADGAVRLKVEGDGKLLATIELKPENRARGEKLALNLKDVQSLKFIVESTDLSPFGRHLILANPKVSR